MSDSPIVAFRAEQTFRDALDKASRIRGVNRSDLIKSWLAARLIAEGFLQMEDADGTD